MGADMSIHSEYRSVGRAIDHSFAHAEARIDFVRQTLEDRRPGEALRILGNLFGNLRCIEAHVKKIEELEEVSKSWEKLGRGDEVLRLRVPKAGVW